MTLIHYVHIPHTIRLNYETTALCLLGEKDGLEAIVADLYNFGFIITTRKSNFPKHWALFPNFKIIHHTQLCKASTGSFPGITGTFLLFKATQPGNSDITSVTTPA